MNDGLTLQCYFSLEGLQQYLGGFGFKKIAVRFSHLVHKRKFLYRIASMKDVWKDQFTMLFKLTE